jgi:hypothetical protein
MSEVKRKELESTKKPQRWSSEEEEEIAENYVLQQNILLSQDRAKKLEHHARATRQPYVKLSVNKKNSVPRTGLVGAIEEKRTRGMSVDEQMSRMMVDQRNYFMQQQQQVNENTTKKKKKKKKIIKKYSISSTG